MHDIRLIRDDPQGFADALQRRGVSLDLPALQELDSRLRAWKTKEQDRQATLNQLERQISEAFREKNQAKADSLKAQVYAIKSSLRANIGSEDTSERELSAFLAALPNLPAPDVPDGLDEKANVVVAEYGERRALQGAREHADFGPALGLDFESAQKVAGARFAYLRGVAARLSRALGQFMLDVATNEFDYEEVNPPLLVRDDAAFGTSQLPKFAEDLFRTTDGRWLIPTAEVSLTNIVREQILREDELPLRFTALTPCFRSEAGAAGRDTRGLIRQHQFEKVELVSVTTPETSEDEHERMTRVAETVLERLEFPYRRMLLCAGDMGFSARKTYDLEVWLPGQGAYREISSCSNCGDFQARRMNARYRKAGEKGTIFVHTLNGSALAVGRTLVAVLENYQEADGSVTVPTALLPYMGGMTKLTPKP